MLFIYVDNFNKLKKKVEINIYKSKSKILTEYEKLDIINNIDKNINFMNNLVYKYYESLINDGLINENITINRISCVICIPLSSNIKRIQYSCIKCCII